MCSRADREESNRSLRAGIEKRKTTWELAARIELRCGKNFFSKSRSGCY